MLLLHLLQYDKETLSDTTKAAESRDHEKRKVKEKETMWKRKHRKNLFCIMEQTDRPADNSNRFEIKLCLSVSCKNLKISL